MLLPCHAAIQDWESFDRDWDHVKDFQPGKSPVDHDSARLLAQAAALAEEYGRSHRAQACGLLAAQQYRALQQPEEADSLELRYGPEDDDPTFLTDEVQTEVFKVPREN